MAAETQVKVVLTMSVPTLDQNDAEHKAIDALVQCGVMGSITGWGASILNAEILSEEEKPCP